MEQTPSSTNIPRIIGIAAVVGILVILLAAYAVQNHHRADVSATISNNSHVTSSTKTSSSSEYKNGTYSSTGTYMSPGGQEEIGLQLTISGDTVTSSNLTEYAQGESRQYQDMFTNGYKSLVIGKKLDDINLTVVSGSSLTSAGFNQALATIKSDAKA
jgi:uncharacterized protein with FMN-binding domain